MTLATVRHKAKLPASALTGLERARLRLIAADDGTDAWGHDTVEDISVGGVTWATYDPDTGIVEFTDVSPNPNITPANTVYELVSEVGRGRDITMHVSVPDSAGPHWADDIETGGPGDLDDTRYLRVDGSRVATGDLDLGGNKVTSVADGVASDDAATVGQLDAHDGASPAHDAADISYSGAASGANVEAALDGLEGDKLDVAGLDLDASSNTLQFRRADADSLLVVNPTLESGELWWDTSFRRAKIGDGSSAWVALPWATPIDLARFAHYREDFLGYVSPFAGDTLPDEWESLEINGGDIYSEDPEVGPHAAGVKRFRTGTSSSSGAAGAFTRGQICDLDDLWQAEFAAKINAVSDASNQWLARFGVAHHNGFLGVDDGAWFEANHGDTNWQCVVANDDGSPAETDSGVAVTAGEFHRFGIVHTGSRVVFAVDGAVVATVTSDLPTSQRGDLFVLALKQAGTGERYVAVDWIDAVCGLDRSGGWG